MECKVFARCLLILGFLGVAGVAPADEPVSVFLLNKQYEPVVRLEKLTPLSEPMRALLAMYSLENGAGCEERTEKGLQCELTAALGVGPQCSPTQVQLVRTWFKTIPNMGLDANPDVYEKIQSPGVLEDVCYHSSETDNVQRRWDRIRVTRNGPEVTVDAVGSFLIRDTSGDFHYRTTYRIEDHSITTLSHTVISSHRRTES